MTANKNKFTWENTRQLFRNIHLWLGLASGILVVVICLSGTIYVFNTEFTEMSAEKLYKVEPVAGVERLPADGLIEKIKAESGGNITAVYLPADPSRTYRFDVKKEGDKSRSGTSYFVNPYTGDITGTSLEKNATKEFMSTMFSLHRWLLLDKIEKPIFSGMTNRELGSKITGWTTIIFTLGCITGMVIWFPRKVRNWRQGLKIKTNGNWKRLIHDLHNAPAFYALIFLLLMGITGPQWSFQWYRDGLQKTLGTYQPKKEGGKEKAAGDKGKPSKKEGADESKNMIAAVNLSAVITNADQQLPYKGDYTVRFAEGKEPLSVTKTRTGFFAPAAGDKLTADAASGKILKTEIFRDKPFNERVAGSIKALHTGNIYGTFTKFIYFLACLIATTLPVTGTIIWLNKLKKKKKRTKIPGSGQLRPAVKTGDEIVVAG